MKDQTLSRDLCIKFPTKYTDIVYHDTEYTGTWGKQNTKYTLRGQQSMSTNTGIVRHNGPSALQTVSRVNVMTRPRTPETQYAMRWNPALGRVTGTVVTRDTVSGIR